MKKKEGFWQRNRFQIYFWIGLLVCFALIWTLTSMEIECQRQGHDGTVTFMFMPTGICYDDNRPDSMKKPEEFIEFVPLGN